MTKRALLILSALLATACSVQPPPRFSVDAFLTSSTLTTAPHTEGLLSRQPTHLVTDPTRVTGMLRVLEFRSESAVDESDYYDPPDRWRLIDVEEAVFFDLGELWQVSDGSFDIPTKVGTTPYHSVHFEFDSMDVTFETAGVEQTVRLVFASIDPYRMGDVLIRDVDGQFKWVSQTGDPDELHASRPVDPVLQSGDPPDFWTEWESIHGPFWVSPAHIEPENYFDVPSTTGHYEIVLDFRFADTVELYDFDTGNYTMRDIAAKFTAGPFAGGGGSQGNILTVVPTVTYTEPAPAP